MREQILHYSESPVCLRPVEYLQRLAAKPSGIWVSVGDEWKRWCEGEEFHCGGLAVCHHVVSAGNVLYIRTPGQIDVFTQEYGHASRAGYIHEINWPSVAERYHGIIIAPYCHERGKAGRMSWYYGWDCASGCIWDLAAISSFGVIEQPCALER